MLNCLSLSEWVGCPEFFSQFEKGGIRVKSKVVLFSGYARLPAGTVASELYGVMALVFLIDVSDGTIVDMECTLSTRLSERFLASLLIGKRLTREATDLIDSIQDVYQGTAKKAIVTSLRIVAEKYHAYLHDCQKRCDAM